MMASPVLIFYAGGENYKLAYILGCGEFIKWNGARYCPDRETQRAAFQVTAMAVVEPFH